jgi:hypothetical protein
MFAADKVIVTKQKGLQSDLKSDLKTDLRRSETGEVAVESVKWAKLGEPVLVNITRADPELTRPASQ